MLEFITPPTASNLVARETVKSEMGLSGTGSDALIDRLIAATTARIVGLCSRESFGLATVRETFYRAPKSCRPYWLAHWPVVSIVSVTLADEVLTGDDFELEAGRKLFRKADGYRVSWGCGKLVVEYQGGYDLPASCAPELQQVCLNTVRASWFDNARDPMVKSEDIPGVIRQEFWVGNIGGAIGGMPVVDAAVLENFTNYATD